MLLPLVWLIALVTLMRLVPLLLALIGLAALVPLIGLLLTLLLLLIVHRKLLTPLKYFLRLAASARRFRKLEALERELLRPSP